MRPEVQNLFLMKIKNNSKAIFFSTLFFCAGCNPPAHNPNEYESVFLQKDDKKSTFVTKSKPKKVILMIGDGMGLTHITAGSIAKKSPLALEKFRHIGLVKTHSTKLITDSAAGATAMATGQKTYNGAIAMDEKQNKLKTIVEMAEESDWATGIVTSTHVTHATPACFFSHQAERRNVNEAVALEFLSTNIEVLMGGGWKYFNNRTDGRDLLAEAEKKGYFIADNMDKFEDYIPKKTICLISPELPERYKVRGDFLPKATQKSIEILNKNSNFFVMIEGGQIDWGGHGKNSEYIIEEMLDFDRAVAKALAFAEKDGNTLVVVTADHETGGYSINGGSLKTGEVEGAFTSDYHTATMVPIFAYGVGAESFSGVYDNTEIFFKLKYLMGL